MHMLDGYSQRNKLIDEPRRVEYSFILVDNHGIIFLTGCAAQSHHQTVISLYGLLHQVETTVARYVYGSNGVEEEFKKAGCLAYRHRHMQRSTLHVRLVKSLEEVLAKVPFLLCKLGGKPLQVYLKML